MILLLGTWLAETTESVRRFLVGEGEKTSGETSSSSGLALFSRFERGSSWNNDSAGTDKDNWAEAFLTSVLGRRDVSSDIVSSTGIILLTVDSRLLLSAAVGASEEDEVDVEPSGGVILA